MLHFSKWTWCTKKKQTGNTKFVVLMKYGGKAIKCYYEVPYENATRSATVFFSVIHCMYTCDTFINFGIFTSYCYSSPPSSSSSSSSYYYYYYYYLFRVFLEPRRNIPDTNIPCYFSHPRSFFFFFFFFFLSSVRFHWWTLMSLNAFVAASDPRFTYLSSWQWWWSIQSQ